MCTVGRRLSLLGWHVSYKSSPALAHVMHDMYYNELFSTWFRFHGHVDITTPTRIERWMHHLAMSGLCLRIRAWRAVSFVCCLAVPPQFRVLER